MRLMSIQLYMKTSVQWNDLLQTVDRKSFPFMNKNTGGKMDDLHGWKDASNSWVIYID